MKKKTNILIQYYIEKGMSNDVSFYFFAKKIKYYFKFKKKM